MARGRAKLGGAGIAARCLVGASLVVLGACQSGSSSPSSASGEGGGALRNLFLFGSTTAPPVIADPLDDAYCPPVDVLDGGAALRALGGGGEGGLRHQISLGQLARECTARPDGSVVVKVGVEARVLLAAGAGGKFDAPLRFVIRRGDTTVASRSRKVAISIPAGDTQGSFTAVEDGIVVPPTYARDYEILVGLGGASPDAGRSRRARR